jgi:hypothetical protein
MGFFEVFKIVLYVVGSVFLLGVLVGIIGMFFRGESKSHLRRARAASF